MVFGAQVGFEGEDDARFLRFRANLFKAATTAVDSAGIVPEFALSEKRDEDHRTPIVGARAIPCSSHRSAFGSLFKGCRSHADGERGDRHIVLPEASR